MTAPLDTAGLVERLRHADQHSPQRVFGSRIFGDAADAIEALSRDLAKARAGEREACAKLAAEQAAMWREAEAEWQTPKNDLTAYTVRTAAKNRAEVAEVIEQAIRALTVLSREASSNE